MIRCSDDAGAGGTRPEPDDEDEADRGIGVLDDDAATEACPSSCNDVRELDDDVEADDGPATGAPMLSPATAPCSSVTRRCTAARSPSSTAAKLVSHGGSSSFGAESSLEERYEPGRIGPSLGSASAPRDRLGGANEGAL